jgi:antitoxin (DNA-binding transcriptional repressor) of toxin-antitoxin stability system
MITATKNKGIVGLKELRENTEQYIAQIEKGASFTVVRRSRPVFTIGPVGDDESAWETIIDFTEIDPNGIPAKELLKRMKETHGQNR